MNGNSKSQSGIFKKNTHKVMKKIWKMWSTLQFIGTGYINGVPPNPVYTMSNRRLFHDHLMRIQGKNTASESWLEHLKRINYYCDQQQVDLLDIELKKLKDLYNQRTNASVHSAVNREKDIFEEEAANFPVDSLNYDLRKYRPGACFLPDGMIQFEEVD